MKKIHKYINTLINKSNFLLLQSISNLQTLIKTLIDTLGQTYFSQISEKSESWSINTKCYWSLLKAFLNAMLNRIVKYYFVEQCSVIRNNITIPESILCQIDTSLAKIVFTTDNIANIIKNLDLNKC